MDRDGRARVALDRPGAGSAGTGSRWWRGPDRLARRVFDALVPPACVACRRGTSPDGPPLCGPCRARLPRLPHPRCRRCAEPLGTLARLDRRLDRCGTCESWWEGLWMVDAPFLHGGAASRVVRGLKYGGWRELAPFMAAEMAGSMTRVLDRMGAPERPYLVPVPLTPARRRERGFNQAEALAVALVERVGGEVSSALGRRPGRGRQAGTGRGQRRANVAGRFRVERPPPRGGRPVVLVDDVLTTGATALACARVLGEAGFGRIAAVTFTRASRSLEGGPGAASDA